MDRGELLRCLKSICAYVKDRDALLIIGSQAAHASIEDSAIPEVVQLSREVDIAFTPSQPTVADSFLEDLNAADFWLGEGSAYADQNGFYMEFVDPGVLVLPADWQHHLKLLPVRTNEGRVVEIKCLSLEDLAVAKILRGTYKDKTFVAEFLESGHLDLAAIAGLIEGDLLFPAGYADSISLMRQRALDFLEQLGHD